MNSKWTDAPCPRCGSAQQVINPKWLRERRERAGLSLRDVGARLGFSAVYICDIELGRRHAAPKVVSLYDTL